MNKENHAIVNARSWLETIQCLVIKLNDDRLTDEQHEEAREEIQEGPLSVSVRSGWRTPNDTEAGSPEEYEILLSTGGPALRIYGQIGGLGEPDDDPRLQWQDWGTPWTDYDLGSEQRAHVCEYARQFWFGE